jgi:hypothetical protein
LRACVRDELKISSRNKGTGILGAEKKHQYQEELPTISDFQDLFPICLPIQLIEHQIDSQLQVQAEFLASLIKMEAEKATDS